jgi:hypothetical protein
MIGEPSLDPPEEADPHELCAECGCELDDDALEVELPGKRPAWGQSVWVCSTVCQGSYLAGYGEYMYDAMNER